MIEIAAAGAEGVETLEITETAEIAETENIVLEPDLDYIQSASPESLKDAVGNIEISIEQSGINVGLEININECMSTYEERINRTPINNGFWEGKRGESKFISNNAEANKCLKRANIDGIEYKNGIPDFYEVSKGNVQIPEMSESRVRNFKQADEQLALQKGCTPREVAEWREKNGYTWHECNDRRTCQKIPTCVNSVFSHLGGVSECKKLILESEFDD